MSFLTMLLAVIIICMIFPAGWLVVAAVIAIVIELLPLILIILLITLAIKLIFKD